MQEQAFKQLNDFFSEFKKLSFKKGETLLRADEKPRGVLYLTKGYVKLYSLSKNAQQLTLIIFKPEDFFPIMWAINGTPNAYYVETMTEVELYKAPRQEFLKFINENVDVMTEINSRILTRFGGVLNRMEHPMFGNATNKVASMILICAERLGKENTRKKSIIIQAPLTHQDIANLIGVVRETVSIEMKKLQKKGLIDYQGKYLIVKNRQKLKEESVF